MERVAIALGSITDPMQLKEIKSALAADCDTEAHSQMTTDMFCDIINVGFDATHKIERRTGPVDLIWVNKITDIDSYRAVVLAEKLRLQTGTMLAYRLSHREFSKLPPLIKALREIYLEHSENLKLLSPYAINHRGQVIARRSSIQDHTRYHTLTLKLKSRLQSLSAETASVLRTISLFS
jgi:hypothetical protein